MGTIRALTISALCLSMAGCGPSQGLLDDGAVADPADAADPLAPDARPFIDGRDPMIPDSGNVFESDAFVWTGDGGACGQAWECTTPVDDGCDVGGQEHCDGVDNDCDGQVDEGCTCTSGAVQSCFAGPPGRRNVGACVDGSQTCQGSGEFTYWGPCVGGIVPNAEVCDSLDNSCNGCVDDNPFCCEVDLSCPGPGDLAEGAPFNPYVIDGTQFYAGLVTSWSWTVTGGPCDQLLLATSGSTSYTLSGENTSTLTFTPTLSGDYTITMTIETAEGTLTCTFIVHIRGPGLRVELCWDKSGSVDLDLHMHKDGTTTPWFTTTTTNTTVNPEDCYFRNCTAQSFYCTGPPVFCPSAQVNWGSAYPDSPLSECSGGPLGANWTGYGACKNPRLDVDNINTAGRPENINLDNPQDGSTYRSMVHYYGGNQTTFPMVNIYCGGRLKSTFGAAPDLVPGFTSGGGFGAGTMWRVADVTTQVSGGVTTDCTVQQLFPPGETGGYRVTVNDRSY